MAWDPSVLRKYSTTSHFRLLNQVRSELKSSPLSRLQDGQINLGMGRRGAPYRVAVEGSGSVPRPVNLPLDASKSNGDSGQGDANSFRDRLRAIQMR